MRSYITKVRRLLALVLTCATVVVSAAALPEIAFSAVSPIRTGELVSSLPLRPYLEFTNDADGTLTIDTVASASYADTFMPLPENGTMHEAGVTWLRFSMVSDASSRMIQEELFPILDLGGPQAGPVELYVPRYSDSAWPDGWTTLIANGDDRLPLPLVEQGSITLYIRLSGPANLWFEPELHLRQATTPIAPFFSAKPYLLGGATILVMLNILLVAMGRGESRFWLALYGLLVCIHAMSDTAPALTGGVPFTAIWSILPPGLALVLLPHVGRHILDTWKTAPSVDRQFRLLSFAGAVLAILPLIPGFTQIVPLLPLWPLFALFSIIPAFRMANENSPGAKRFILACAFTAIGGILSLWPSASAEAARVASQAPLAGTLLGLLTLTPLIRIPVVAEPDCSPDAEMLEAATGLRLTHDLQTPLIAITHATENINATMLNEQQRMQLRTIQAATQNLETLIDDLLTLSRAESGRLQLRNRPFDLHQLLMEAHDIVSPQAEHKALGLSWYMDPHLPVRYHGDADRLLQIILTLLGNGIRFTDSGQIRLTVSRIPEGTDAGHLLFTVTDTGLGIPLQNQYSVLNNYTISPGTGSGGYSKSGTGLTVVQELVHLMGGVLCIESSPNGGSQIAFSVRLRPSSADMEITMPPVRWNDDAIEAPFGIPPATAPDRIMIVDDVASNRQLISFFLEGQPYSLCEARNGEEALAAYRHAPCGLIILDADMPGMGGAGTVKAIRDFESEAGLPSVPILALTARQEETEAMQAAGCTAMLAKPIMRRRLIDIVASLTPAARRTSTEVDEKPADQLHNEHVAPASFGTQKTYVGAQNHTEHPTESFAQDDDFAFEQEDAVTGAESASVRAHETSIVSQRPDTKPHQSGYLEVQPHTELTSENSDSAAKSGSDIDSASKESVFSSLVDAVQKSPFAQKQHGVADIITEAALETEQAMVHSQLVETVPPQDDGRIAPRHDDGNTVTNVKKPHEQLTVPQELEQELIPLVSGALANMTDAMLDARTSLDGRSSLGVQSAVSRLAGTASGFRLYALERMARCVEEAAQAEDLEAVETLMPDLENMFRRNRKALLDIQRMHEAMENSE